ncbi:MAG: UDP-N-acetylmuramoyl-tripeptide--D-alanyl-D-alanine ligase [Fimbriimonas sp.]
MHLLIQDLAVRLGGQSVGFEEGAVATGFATDSRAVKPGDLFLGIQGERSDGHEFAAECLRAGSVGTIAERPVEGPHILVGNLVKALATMAASFRSEYNGPVVGITGSAGKTTTKELLAAALSPLGPVLKTQGNRNTEYTSPLMWAELDATTKAVVVEMAMRGFGQIAHLASFSRPTVGIITNIGFAHLQQVGSRKGIARAKSELFETLPERNGLGIVWQGDPYLDILSSRVKSGRVRTFGFTEYADCRITEYQALRWDQCDIAGTLDGEEWSATLPFVGRHLALDAAAAVLAAASVGVAPALAASRLYEVALPPMRMQVVEHQGIHFVLDFYNASPPSMVNAIETLAELPVAGRRMAVIGEMRELGEHVDEAHEMVGHALARQNLDMVFFYGPATEIVWNTALRDGMSAERFVIADTLDEITQFLMELKPGDAVLIKGSRALELERSLTPLGLSVNA